MIRERNVARAAVSQPREPTPAIATADDLESFDDDLAWIISKFIERTGASDGVLSVHHSDDGVAELLFAHGRDAGDASFEDLVIARSAVALGRDRRRDDGANQADWGDLNFTGKALRTLSIPLASDSHGRIVLTAVYDLAAAAETGPIDYAATRLQPVLVGYFKLWLLNRAQRRRIDGLASALNFTDIAIFLLDGAGSLLFTNYAGRGLLDDIDGIRRVGSGITATDMGDAVKLRVAIEHVIGMDRDEGDVLSPEAPIVPLRRRDDRRALIASVMPVERSPVSPGDPTVILYVFSPDIQVGLLLAPICQIYGLSPAETRLVGLLAEGLSVADAAVRMRVKVPTLRTYLKQIFVKTETARQSDLIRLMMGSLVRTRPGVLHTII